MSSPPSPLVWFLLLDSATGLPYKGTSADYVSLPPGSVIAQFRKSVKTENPNKLSSFDAADLLVYKNKATRETLPSMKERKSRSKKTLSWMVLERRRRRPSLLSSRRQEAPVEVPLNPVSSEKSRIPKESSDG